MIKKKYQLLLIVLKITVFQHSLSIASEAPFLEWTINVGPYSDHHLIHGYHGCGTPLGSYSEVGSNPEKMAERACVFEKAYGDCVRARGWVENVGVPPVTSGEYIINDSSTATIYNYQFRCTPVNSPITAIHGAQAIVSKGTFNASDNPKNNGPSCPSAGNPINPMVGNKFQNETVYNGVKSLAFNIAYNSNYDTEQKLLGDVWRSPYDRAVSADVLDELGLVGIRRQDGRGFGFENINGVFVASADKTYSLTQLTDDQGTTTGWQFNNDVGGDTELYDVNGKLLSITNRAGLTQTLTYSTPSTLSSIAPEAGLLIQVTDHVGRSLHFTYDADKRVSTMIDPAGAVYAYTYNADNYNLLKTVTFADGASKTFHYGSETTEIANVEIQSNGINLNNRSLTGITDENGSRYATWKYDARARAISSEHAGGADSTTLVYNANGLGESHPLNTVVTDARGTARTYKIISTAIHGVLKSTGTDQPAGAGCAASGSNITYDANGNIATRTDFNGNQTTYAYDMSRNLETSRTEGLTAAGTPTAATRTITTSSHPTW